MKTHKVKNFLIFAFIITFMAMKHMVAQAQAIPQYTGYIQGYPYCSNLQAAVYGTALTQYVKIGNYSAIDTCINACNKWEACHSVGVAIVFTRDPTLVDISCQAIVDPKKCELSQGSVSLVPNGVTYIMYRKTSFKEKLPCNNDQECPNQICENGQCRAPYCTSNAQCSNPSPICRNGRCVPCGEDQECELGVCKSGSCEKRSLKLCN